MTAVSTSAADDRVAMPLATHASLLVLPFGFEDFQDTSERLEAASRWRPVTFDPDDPVDRERTAYFLPYVRRFWFPSTDRTPSMEPPCRRWRFDRSALGPDLHDLSGTLTGKDCVEVEDFSGTLRIASVELVAFSFEVGFLILECDFGSGATYREQMVALGMARLLEPLFLDYPMPVWTVGGRPTHLRQWAAFFLAEFGPQAAKLPTEPDAAAALPVRLIYDDRMLVYAYSGLATAGIDEVEQLPDRGRTLNRWTTVPFEDADLHRQRQARSENVNRWLRVRLDGFGKDGAVSVAHAVTDFETRFLPLYHRTYYFDVFLLALLQRVTLILLSERLSDIDSLTTGSAAGRRKLARLRRDLLRFKNQCCFTQITLRDKGMELWKRWQGVFENGGLLAEVNEQSGELEDYLQTRSRERFETLARVGGFLVAAVPAVFGLDAAFGDAPWVVTAKWTTLTLLLVGSGLFALWTLLKRDPA